MERKRRFTDQMGRKIQLIYPPKRIISIVPSQTELLFYLGMEKEVVGITKFCVHPKEKFKIKPRVGGTKKLNFGKIEELQPDLIIANKEENEQSQIEALAKKYPVWLSDILTFADALEMIEDIGKLCGKTLEAEALVKSIQEKVKHFQSESMQDPSFSRKKVAYLIWKKPYMVAGSNTFIDSMLQLAGFENVFREKQRYPEISLEQLKKAKPEVILLSSEPYPFKAKHLPEFQEACPEAKILIVDGEMFSWYGNRLLQAVDYFRDLQLKIR